MTEALRLRLEDLSTRRAAVVFVQYVVLQRDCVKVVIAAYGASVSRIWRSAKIESETRSVGTVFDVAVVVQERLLARNNNAAHAQEQMTMLFGVCMEDMLVAKSGTTEAGRRQFVADLEVLCVLDFGHLGRSC